ncbi:hypothetical protein KKD52_03140 [Myxococcota bacterium]|nr:hypothetical protein [Myxococcota bacterium]MBU1412390.1 hypothetical protein [Myxococcota bacterium]MBU1509334.1 hypothetical protein [Myxococcota bacterium]
MKVPIPVTIMPSVPLRILKPHILTMILLFFTPACCPCGKRDATPEKKPAAVVEKASQLPAAAAGFVRCEGELVSVESHPWHQQVSGGQGGDSVDDGVSPLASFRIIAPPEAAGRTVGVLFKYAKQAAAPPSTDTGKRFTLDLPGTFLDGSFATLDNDQVMNLRALEQPHEK